MMSISCFAFQHIGAVGFTFINPLELSSSCTAHALVTFVKHLITVKLCYYFAITRNFLSNR